MTFCASSNRETELVKKRQVSGLQAECTSTKTCFTFHAEMSLIVMKEKC